MSTEFKKVSAKRAQAVRKKGRPVLKKPPTSDASKTPVTRVGDERDHHDTLSTEVVYVLVDQPKDPEDSVAFDQGSKVWPMAFTTNAEPLTDTTLVFVLSFEHVADKGKCTLKLKRGESTVEIFKDVEFKDLFLYDFISSDKKLPADDVLGKRVLDYTTVQPRPPYGDATLDQKAPPHSSLGKKDQEHE